MSSQYSETISLVAFIYGRIKSLDCSVSAVKVAPYISIF